MTFHYTPPTGTLIFFEGPDGSGKTTLIRKIEKRCRKLDIPVTVSVWKTAPIFGPYLQAQDTKKSNDRTTAEANLFLQATDFLYRLEKEILPALQAGHIVLVDRGPETLIVRGLMIGMTEDQITKGLLWFTDYYKEVFAKAITLGVDIGAKESLRRVYKRSFQENKKDLLGTGTLLSLHMIRNMQYNERGDAMTHTERHRLTFQTQQKICELYHNILQKRPNVTKINGGFLKKQVLNTVIETLFEKQVFASHPFDIAEIASGKKRYLMKQ